MNESTDPISLTDFLLARIAEDEAAARDANYWADLMAALGGGPNARHGARHNPARVLAECEAKRRIVSRYLTYRDRPRPNNFVDGGIFAVSLDLQDLAAIYADHPDYREEWKS